MIEANDGRRILAQYVLTQIANGLTSVDAIILRIYFN